MNSDSPATVSFVAGAPQIGPHPIFPGVKDGFDGILNTPEVRGLDLHHICSPGINKIHNILISIAPFIGHDLHPNPALS